jgi:transposase
VEAGSSARSSARVFGVSESTAVKWIQRWRRTGSVAAKRMGGYRRSPLDDHAELLLGLIADRPDLTVEEIRGVLRARGIYAGHGSVWRFFKRHGISFKKNRTRQRAGKAGRGGGARKVAAKSAGV